ncbi:MAG: OmpA family protein [Rhodospirillaceae bacterium]|nr:OmpA family protein [Rhodospirillaceae bacterium]
MAAAKKPLVLIKRVRKGRGHAHHGGAWKVAYADFVTAMMAFFLLLWLLNATTEEQRKGIANYFQPTLVQEGASGSNGLMGGRTLSSEGAMPESAGPPTISFDPAAEGQESAVVSRSAAPGEEDEAAATGADAAPERDSAAPARAEAAAAADGEAGAHPPVSDQAALEHVARLEEQQFRKAEAELRAAIADDPALQKLAESLVIDHTPDGMRIQIVDQANVSMFPLGSSEMYDATRELLRQVAMVVAKLPNRLAVSGHTDARPYADGKGYSNWELSSDRANACRRVLVEAGVPDSRFASVTGRADKEPFVPDDPYSPRNRRISITVLYDTPPAMGPH